MSDKPYRHPDLGDPDAGAIFQQRRKAKEREDTAAEVRRVFESRAEEAANWQERYESVNRINASLKPSAPKPAKHCPTCACFATKDKPGRYLTEREIDFCDAHRYTQGFDVDDDLPQGTHVCFPWSPSDDVLGRGSAFCQTDRLWFSGGGWNASRNRPPEFRAWSDGYVTCEECLRRFEMLMVTFAE